MERVTDVATVAVEPGTEPPRRIRRGRKRRFTKLPRPVYPVRALWEMATQEEKARAHELCVAIIEWWTGRATRAELAERLKLPPLRLWQMSQQALAGMLAGLLRQPKSRPKQGVTMIDPLNDPKVLRKENEQLKRRLQLAEDLIKILRQLPGMGAMPAAQGPAPKKAAEPQAAAKNPRKRSSRSVERGDSPTPPGPEIST